MTTLKLSSRNRVVTVPRQRLRAEEAVTHVEESLRRGPQPAWLQEIRRDGDMLLLLTDGRVFEVRVR